MKTTRSYVERRLAELQRKPATYGQRILRPTTRQRYRILARGGQP